MAILGIYDFHWFQKAGFMAKKKDGGSTDADMFADLAKDIGGDILGTTDSVKEWIDTGNLALNYLCSGKFVGGGIPSGKIVEVYGPSSSCKTLFATNILKGCQKMGGYSLFLDAENSLSKDFAEKASHLETSKVLVLRAESLQKAFAKMIAAIKKIREKFGPDKPIVIVYDSIAASPSDREMAETDMSESELEKAKDMPGERARTCSKELRKLTPLLAQHNCTVLFINQVRMKINVMFGCFSKDTNVCFSDGRLVSIKDVVENRMTGPVKCYNKETGKLGSANITNWFENGSIDYENGERWLHYKISGSPSGEMEFTCTPNHSVLKKHENSWKWVSAESVHVGDVMMSYNTPETSTEMVPYPVTVVQKSEGSPDHHISLKKYDIEVSGHGAYLVGGNPGVVVSNSPETTAGGGKALEYYTSLRLRTKAEKRFTDKLDNVIGMGVSITNVKNKCFKPFIDARNMQLLFDQGINPFGGLLELLVKTERISQSGPGNYKVNEPYAGGQEIKFKSSFERNDVPAEVLLKCPAIVDASSASQVQEYIDIFGSALRGMADRVAGEEVVQASDDE